MNTVRFYIENLIPLQVSFSRKRQINSSGCHIHLKKAAKHGIRAAESAN